MKKKPKCSWCQEDRRSTKHANYCSEKCYISYLEAQLNQVKWDLAATEEKLEHIKKMVML